MEERYCRNRIYVKESEQEAIKKYRILLGGAGIGSIIAECALRFGFENITIVDGDKVELSNLNRQNYEESDLGHYKAERLAHRLLRINPEAKIDFHTCYINKDNVEEFIKGHDVAINALDFKSDIPFIFDKLCQKSDIPVLHPYNFGWAGFLAVVKPKGFKLSLLSHTPEGFEVKMAQYVSKYSSFWNISRPWLDQVIDSFKEEKGTQPAPQLSIGSWIAAGFCVNVMYNLVTGKEVKTFPKFYLSSIYCDNN